MRQVFFGPGNHRLYGVFSEPPARVRGAPAVLLCYPGVHEYNTSHWAFRRLAGSLARAGVPSLRFDYSGTGDSDGDASATTLEAMRSNVSTAGQELLDLTGARKLWLVGLRLGGSVAALASASALPVKGVVLWDCVSSGRVYLEQLKARDQLRDLLLLHWAQSRRKQGELLGYTLCEEVRRSLLGLNLVADLERAFAGASGKGPERVSILSERSQDSLDDLAAFWRRRGAVVEQRRIAADSNGGDREVSGNEVVLSAEAIATMVELIGGATEK